MKVFESKRTIIRPFRNNDFERIKSMLTDPDVMKFTGFKKPQSLDKINELFNKWKTDINSSLGVWCVEEKSNGLCIGWFMLKVTDSNIPELGYMISKEKWGKGFATEVAREFLRLAFNDLEIPKVMARTDKVNDASVNILKKIGMVEKTSLSDESPNLIHFEIERESDKC